MELANEMDLNRINKTIEEKSPKASFMKEKFIIQQKILNHLIDVYQTKAKYQTPHSTSHHLSFKSPLPFIRQHQPLSPLASNDESSKRSQEAAMPSPIKRDNQKDRLSHLRMIFQFRTRQKAREQRDKMQILNDNLRLYKDNVILENINKRNVVKTKKRIIEDSIGNYKQFKKNYIQMINNHDIESLRKVNKRKENELLYWKQQMEGKMKKSSSVTSNLFLTQKEEPSGGY